MLKQRLQHKLLQNLSPQQIQLIRLLELPITQLEQRIKEELEQNPALEEGIEKEDTTEYQEEVENSLLDVDSANKREDFDIDPFLDDDEIPSYKTYTNNLSDEEKTQQVIENGASLQQQLIEQLNLLNGNLSSKNIQIAEYLIGSLDEEGYLRRDIESITDELAFRQGVQVTDAEVLQSLKLVQTLEPSGIGARDLIECLLLQLNRKKQTVETKRAIVIVQEFFEELATKRFEKIIKKLRITQEELLQTLKEITQLNPKPGLSLSNSAAQFIIPDFIIETADNKVIISLHDRNTTPLTISKEYTDLFKEYNSKDKNKNTEAIQFIKQKITEGQWFMEALRHRNIVMIDVMKGIVGFQHDFFLDGDISSLKPMILKDVADLIGADISTISRVVNSKYAQTNFGTFLLKELFSDSIQNDEGTEISTKEIKRLVKELVDTENKKSPYNDDQLLVLLNKKGIQMSRRTITKYREQMSIPTARIRREL